jgi:hypothetical protein
VTPSPNEGRYPELQGVSCTSATNCVAVGDYGIPVGAERSLIESWNGRLWSIVPSPNPSNSLDRLGGVSCTTSTNCVAIGYYVNGSGVPQTLVESWNGTVWSVPPSPGPGALDGVFCTHPTKCLAVGSEGNASGESGTLIESWNGAAWTVTPSPNKGTSGNVLLGVSCKSPTNCLAVGSYGNESGTLIESWNGTAWTVTPSSNPSNTVNRFRGTSCASTTNCVAVGDYVNDASGFDWSLVETGSASLLAIITTSLPDGTVRQHYSATLAATGGNPPYRWSVSSGHLPKGLHLKKSMGVIHGTPNKHDSGTYTFTVKVVDKKIKVSHRPPMQNTATKVLSITIS